MFFFSSLFLILFPSLIKKKNQFLSALKTDLFFICFNRGVLIAAYKKNVPLCSWLHSTERRGCQVCMASLFFFLKLIWEFRCRFAPIRKHSINGWNAESIFLHVRTGKKKRTNSLHWSDTVNTHSLQPRLAVETPSTCTRLLFGCKEKWNESVFFFPLTRDPDLIFWRPF